MAPKPAAPPAPDTSNFCKSLFTVTFTVEIIGLNVWRGCNEDILELGPCEQSMKIKYQLYPKYEYDLDISIWSHVVRISCGVEYGWVRTWQYLERRWFSFSIRHAFPVRVLEFKTFVATVHPLLGPAGNTKNENMLEVLLPPLGFSERRYFAPVLEEEETLTTFVTALIWNKVVQYIPWSIFDESLDTPGRVTDVRHQDAVLEHVSNATLNRQARDDKSEVQKSVKHFEIELSGDAILCATGRIVPFEVIGERPHDLGEIITLIGSNNLPAQDDLPIIFVNVEKLSNIPVQDFKSLGINHLYTMWKIGNKTHKSNASPLNDKKNNVDFKDHYALPIPHELFSETTAHFLEGPQFVELRGIISEDKLPIPPKLFGYEKQDCKHYRRESLPKVVKTDNDVIIAVAKIDARQISKGVNALVRGEYSLYPPRQAVRALQREAFCTNDINAIRLPVEPTLLVKPEVILKALMFLEVSIGLVGCKPRQASEGYLRMFCVIRDPEAAMIILRQITNKNEEVLSIGKNHEFLYGFALDIGDIVVLYVEGPRDGHLLEVWDMTEDFYPRVKPLFSCTDSYSTRIYPEFVSAGVPFVILKMFAPLSLLLACPPVYARPALPVPARSAALKLGRLVTSNIHPFPVRHQMPTAEELRSFRLELCVAPRPTPITITDAIGKASTQEEELRLSIQNVSKIVWGQKKTNS